MVNRIWIVRNITSLTGGAVVGGVDRTLRRREFCNPARAFQPSSSFTWTVPSASARRDCIVSFEKQRGRVGGLNVRYRC